jgi:hypothetical protein
MKIPSYKYKFKQIFMKIGQPKLLILLMYSANFYFVAVLTWTMKVKNSPSSSDYRAKVLSEYSYAPDETHAKQYLPLMKHIIISIYPW